MPIDPNTTLGQFAINPDGKTYDGRKVVQLLIWSVSGKLISDDQANELIENAKARAAAKLARHTAAPVPGDPRTPD